MLELLGYGSVGLVYTSLSCVKCVVFLWMCGVLVCECLCVCAVLCVLLVVLSVCGVTCIVGGSELVCLRVDSAIPV